MSHRPPRFSEALQLGLGPNGMVIECDACGDAIDAFPEGEWTERVTAGTMYAGRVLCPDCYRRERDEEANQAG